MTAGVQRQIERARREQLENLFLQLWVQLGGPPLRRQLRFCPGRRWTADFAHCDARVLIEVEGGTFQSGRHVRGRGYSADCVKYNTATAMGWEVYRVTRDMLDERPDEHLGLIIRRIREKRKE